MTLLRRVLREPVFSGQPVFSGHLEGSRGCPLNTGLTVCETV